MRYFRQNNKTKKSRSNPRPYFFLYLFVFGTTKCIIHRLFQKKSKVILVNFIVTVYILFDTKISERFFTYLIACYLTNILNDIVVGYYFGLSPTTLWRRPVGDIYDYQLNLYKSKTIDSAYGSSSP